MTKHRLATLGMYALVVAAVGLSAWSAITIANVQGDNTKKDTAIATLAADVIALRKQITDLCNLPESPNCAPVAPAPSADVLKGATGERGPKGDQGIQGDRGPGPSESDILLAVAGYCRNTSNCDGPQGVAGADGATGPTGQTGPAGNPGSPGADSQTPGPTGAQGASGPAGQQGEPGVAGPAGAKGDAGPTGPQGPPPSGGTIIIPGVGTLDCVPDSADPTRFICTPQGA